MKWDAMQAISSLVLSCLVLSCPTVINSTYDVFYTHTQTYMEPSLVGFYPLIFPIFNPTNLSSVGFLSLASIYAPVHLLCMLSSVV